MKKKFFKRLGIVLAAVVAGIFVLGLIAKYWVIPGIIASRIQAAVAEQWDGETKVGAVDFDFSGPILLHNVEIRDRAHRPWVDIGSVELGLRNWPGTSPVLTTVDVRQVAVRAHFANGYLDLPSRKQVKASSPPGEKSQSIDIQRLTIRDISFTIIEDQAHQATWALGQFEATRQSGDVYGVSLTSPPQTAGKLVDGQKSISLSGSINRKTYEADLLLDGNVPTDSSRMAVILRAMKVSVIKGIDGRFHSDGARLRGRLDDPALWQLTGQIELKGFQFQGPYASLASNLDCAMKLDGRSIRITQFGANGCGGSVMVSGEADIGPDWRVSYRGVLNANNVDVPALTETIAGPGKKAQRGILSLQVKCSGIDGDIHGLGLLGMDNADVMTMSIFAEIFKQMGLGSNDQLRKSDLQAVFTFDGPQVTVSQARLANPLSALDMEKGGQINVRTRQLDLHVMGVPLKAVEGILKLPVIGILSEPFRNLRDKLIRLHVQGDWSAPSDTLVRKEPVTDVAEGTVGVFKDVAKSGGKLGEGALKAVNDLFHALGGGH